MVSANFPTRILKSMELCPVIHAMLHVCLSITSNVAVTLSDKHPNTILGLLLRVSHAIGAIFDAVPIVMPESRSTSRKTISD